MTAALTFEVVGLARPEVEITSWKDGCHCFDTGPLHVTLRRPADGHELHLHGEDAHTFLRIIRAAEMRGSLKASE